MTKMLKRIVTVTLCIALIISSICTSLFGSVSAYDVNVAESEYKIDFNDGNDNIAAVYSGYSSHFDYEVIDDGDNNKSLAVTIKGDNNNIVFPIKLESGKTYKYSFKYKISQYSKKDTSKNYQLLLDLYGSQKTGYRGNKIVTAWNWPSFTGVMENYKTTSGSFTPDSTMLSAGDLLTIRISRGSNVKDCTIIFDDIIVTESAGAVVFNTNASDCTIPQVTGKAGVPVTLPSPKRNGYYFIGWYTDSNLTQGAANITVPASGNTVNLYAKWEEIVIDKDNNVVYDFEDGKDNIYAVYSGYKNNFDYNVVDDGENNKSLAITVNADNNNIVLPFQLEENITYNYSFKYRIETFSKKDENKSYQLLLDFYTSQTNGYRGNKIFTAWNWPSFTGVMENYKTTSGSFTIDSSLTSGGKLLSFKVSRGSNVKDCVIYFDDIVITEAGGAVKFDTNCNDVTVNMITGEPGEAVTLPVPSRSGYYFLGWYLDEEFSQRAENITVPASGQTLTLYANWEEIPKNTDNAVYDFNDGKDKIYSVYSGYKSQFDYEVVDDGENNKSLAITVKGDNNLIVLPFELEAGKTYQYSFDYRITSYSKKDESGKYQLLLDFKTAEKNGYRGNQVANIWNWLHFSGVMNDYQTSGGVFTTSNENVTNSAKLLAFQISRGSNVKDCVIYFDNITVKEVGGAIKFNTNASNVSVNTMIGEPGEAVDLPIPQRNGYYFVNWYEDAALTETAENVTIPVDGSTLTLYAKWEEIEISSNNAVYDFQNGKSNVFSIYAGYKSQFDYKVVDDGQNNKSLAITVKGDNNLIVLPFELESGKTYQYSFDYRIVSYSKKDENGNYQLLLDFKTAQKNGYRGNIITTAWNWPYFDAAMDEYETTSGVFTATEDAVIENAKLLAFQISRSSNVKDCVIYFDNITIKEAGGAINFNTNATGVKVNTIIGESGEAVELPIPSRSGYRFIGWYTDAQLTIKAENVTIPTDGSTLTLYAKWEEVPVSEFNAIYDFEDGKDNIYSVYSGYKSQFDYEVVNDGENNKSLAITVKGDNNLIVLPFKLEAGKAYNYSFKYRIAEYDKKDENGNYQLLLDFKTAEKNGYLGNQIATVWNWPNFEGVTEEYATTKGVFSTDSSVVTEKANLLALRISRGSNVKDCVIYFDDITIKEAGGAIKFDTGCSVKVNTITGEPGEKVTLPVPNRVGYRFIGWYTDAQLTQKAESVTIPTDGSMITLYAKWEKISTSELNAIYDFEDGKDNIYSVYSGYKNQFNYEVVNDGENNKSLAITVKGDNNLIVLPFKLEAGKKYEYSFKYRLASYSKKDENMNYQLLLDFKTAQQNGYRGNQLKTVWNWIHFNGIMSDYKITSGAFETDSTTVTEKEYLFAMQISRGSYVKDCVIYFDDISFKAVDSTIDFVAEYEGIDVCATKLNGAIGEVANLTSVKASAPYEVTDWYYDKEFTKPVGDTYSFTKDDITLYGKVEYNTKSVIDFEDPSVVLFTSQSNGAHQGIVSDPENPSNKVYSGGTAKANDNFMVKLDYMWRANRRYTITFRYKVSIPTGVQMAWRLANSKNVWNCAGPGFDNTFAFSLYGPVDVIDWQTMTFSLITDDPVVNDEYKYLYLMMRDTTSKKGTFYFDDIEIVDTGAFVASEYSPNIDTFSWNDVSDDGIYSMWEFWINNPKGDESTESDDSNVALPPQNTEENATNVDNLEYDNDTTYNEGYDFIWIIAAVVFIILIVTIIIIVILKKRKKRIS